MKVIVEVKLRNVEPHQPNTPVSRRKPQQLLANKHFHHRRSSRNHGSMRNQLKLSATILIVLLLGGCADSGASLTSSAEINSPPPNTTASTQLPKNGAPQVEMPLTLDRYQQQPCDVLTQAQLKEFYS